jgi:LmbE family N-acetylglucosaminyl deacetylase
MVTPESEAIPYQAQDLRGERLLVLAPHPDDEVIGCGGVVAQHIRDGRQVTIVIATDGAAAGNGSEREAESRRGLAVLAGERTPPEPRFLRFADRALAGEIESLRNQLATILAERKPDLILVPSPIEIHPDHLALARAFCELIQMDASLFADLATARIAFYEVGQPLRPNALVDISDVAETKYAAIAAHTSQMATRDYVAFARGLNAFRAMTIENATFVEAYWTMALPSLRTQPLSALREAIGTPPRIEVMAEPLPISVIVRTKDRPDLLSESIDSIRATRYPVEIVVVNDGGETPSIDDVKLIEHKKSLGRSRAANRGVDEASNAFIAFLDDDDLVYPDHFEVLAASARRAPCYSDAVSSFVRNGVTEKRLRIYSRDFDRDLLFVDNYIPLPTLLIPRHSFLDLGGFDDNFDLFEDWEFLIRLAQLTPFTHVPRVTCEVRHIEGSGSIVMASPAGSSQFTDAKLQVWRKNAAFMTHELFANTIETLKRDVMQSHGESVEALGARHQMSVDVERLDREKTMLIRDAGALHVQIGALHARIGELTLRAAQLEGANEELRHALGLAQHERNELLVRLAEIGIVRDQLADVRGAFDESQRTVSALYAEIARLQGLLDTIYGSRTWKLHTMVEKMKGRG